MNRALAVFVAIVAVVAGIAVASCRSRPGAVEKRDAGMWAGNERGEVRFAAVAQPVEPVADPEGITLADADGAMLSAVADESRRLAAEHGAAENASMAEAESGRPAATPAGMLAEGAKKAEDAGSAALPEASGVRAPRRLATSQDLRPRAPALMARPHGPDSQELPLEVMRVATLLGATRARVLVDCTFRNPFPAQLQGTFLVKLPDGASPSYLGMFQGAGHATSAFLPPPLDPAMLLEATPALPAAWTSGAHEIAWGELRPARVVEQSQGKVVYERVTRRRIDPALMEWSGGNSFSTRIFPIPPHGRKRVIFAYDQPLSEMAGRVGLSLPVPENLPPAFRLEAAADARAYEGGSLALGTGEAPLRADGAYLRGEWLPEGGAGDREGAFVLAAKPRDARIQAGTAASPGIAGGQVHARVRPVVKRQEGRATGDAVFLVDTSASQRQKLGALGGRLLRAILEGDASIERFRVVAFDIAARPVFEGWRKNGREEREKTAAQVEALALEGATSIEAALGAVEREAGAAGATSDTGAGTYFLLSDAQVTWGLEERRELERGFPKALAQRWVTYQIGDSAVNRPLMERLTRGGGRIVNVASAEEIPAAALAHRSGGARLKGVRVEGVEGRDLVVAGAPQTLYPDQTLEVAFRSAGADVREGTLVVETDAGAQRFPLAAACAGDPLAARAWAELASAQLLDLEDEDADKVVVALSQKFAIANRTASFLILETDAEYTIHQVKSEELDLARLAKLANDKVARRPVGAPDASKLSPETLARLDALAATKALPWPRRAPGNADEAVRKLSSTVEDHPRDAKALRLVGFQLMGWGRYEDAAALFARARRSRPFEPQAYLCEGLALQALGRVADAALLYEIVLAGDFDPRHASYAKVGARRLYDRLLGRGDLPRSEVHLFWNLDDTDVDMHIRESKGHEVSYRNRKSKGGGELLWDNTAGLGPEIYTHPRHEPREVFVNYFGSSSVEGTVPSATLLVVFGRAPVGEAPAVHVASAVLSDRRAKVTLHGAGAAD